MTRRSFLLALGALAGLPAVPAGEPFVVAAELLPVDAAAEVTAFGKFATKTYVEGLAVIGPFEGAWSSAAPFGESILPDVADLVRLMEREARW